MKNYLNSFSSVIDFELITSVRSIGLRRKNDEDFPTFRPITKATTTPLNSNEVV